MKTPLALLPALLVAPVLASDVLVVDPHQAGAFATIQAAVHSAANGDVILVRAGTYLESVAVSGTGLTLVADGVARIDGTVEVSATPGVGAWTQVPKAPGGPPRDDLGDVPVAAVTLQG